MTSVAEQNPAPIDPRRWSRPRGALGEDVAKTVARLQNQLFAERTESNAIAVLAKLRRAIGREPGSDYTLEDHLGVPENLLAGWTSTDKAADVEFAKHAAVTLYALHQQSQRTRMHTDGRGLGLAIRELTDRSKLPDGVRRRFAALGTAISYNEALYHLRSLIVMLREQSVQLDYGLLAHDLAELRKPGGRARIQAAWGREFFRTRRSADEAGSGEEDMDADTNTDNDNEETPQ